MDYRKEKSKCCFVVGITVHMWFHLNRGLTSSLCLDEDNAKLNEQLRRWILLKCNLSDWLIDYITRVRILFHSWKKQGDCSKCYSPRVGASPLFPERWPYTGFCNLAYYIYINNYKHQNSWLCSTTAAFSCCKWRKCWPNLRLIRWEWILAKDITATALLWWINKDGI